MKYFICISAQGCILAGDDIVYSYTIQGFLAACCTGVSSSMLYRVQTPVHWQDPLYMIVYEVLSSPGEVVEAFFT